MNKVMRFPLGMPQREFDQEGKRILRELQGELLPDHAAEIIAINVTTGEYVLGTESLATRIAFRKRFPDEVAFISRVDGGAVVKFHGK